MVGVTRFATLFGAVIIASCSVPETRIGPGPHLLIVHAMLDLGASKQSIQLGYSDKPDAVDSSLLSMTVTITTPDGVVMSGVQDSVKASNTAYSRLPAFTVTPSAYGVALQPGATYTLEVRNAGGLAASGTTTVPKATSVGLSSFVDIFRRQTDTLHLTWQDGVEATAYFISVDRISVSGTNPSAFRTFARFTTGHLALAGIAKDVNSGDDVFPLNARVAVVVSAVDRNFYEYYRTPGDPFTAAAPSRLNGALGVFGSMVPLYGRRFDIR